MVRGGEVCARRIPLSDSSVCSVGGGHGVPDADTISARPRKWITSNGGPWRQRALGSRRRQNSYLMVPVPLASPQMTPPQCQISPSSDLWLKRAQLEFK